MKKPYEIVNESGKRVVKICFVEEEHAKTHLNFIQRFSKRWRGLDIYAKCKVQKRT